MRGGNAVNTARVIQDPHSGKWYVINRAAERIHGPYDAPPYGFEVAGTEESVEGMGEAVDGAERASTHPDTLAQDLREIAEEIVDPRTEEGRTLLIAAEKLDRYRAALEQICSTPSRNWHLNARIAREAMR